MRDKREMRAMEVGAMKERLSFQSLSRQQYRKVKRRSVKSRSVFRLSDAVILFAKPSLSGLLKLQCATVVKPSLQFFKLTAINVDNLSGLDGS